MLHDRIRLIGYWCGVYYFLVLLILTFYAFGYEFFEKLVLNVANTALDFNLFFARSKSWL